MSKVKSFVKLDAITSKPYIMEKSRIIFFVGAILFMFVISEGISGGLAVSVMFSNIFAGYPFAAKLDALYASLAIDKKTVVMGRYLFSYGISILTTLVVFAIGLAIVPLSFGFLDFMACDCCNAVAFGQMLTILAVIAVLQILLQSISLPVSFKWGDAGRMVFAIIPMLFLMALMRLSSIPAFADVLGSASGRVVTAVVGIGLAAAVYVSYRLSLRFYMKREF